MNRERMLRGVQKLTNSGPYHYQKAWNFNLNTWVNLGANDYRSEGSDGAGEIARDLAESTGYDVLYDPADPRHKTTSEAAEKFEALRKLAAEGACGTAACAGGSFALDDWFRDQGLLIRFCDGEMTPYCVDESNERTRPSFAGMAYFFDIPEEVAETLFAPSNYAQDERKGEKGRLAVAKRMLELLTHGYTSNKDGEICRVDDMA